MRRLISYERNKDWMPEAVVLSPAPIPNWPEAGFRQLTLDHRQLIPPISAAEIENYFIHRQVNANSKAISQLLRCALASHITHGTAQQNSTGILFMLYLLFVWQRCYICRTVSIYVNIFAAIIEQNKNILTGPEQASKRRSEILRKRARPPQ